MAPTLSSEALHPFGSSMFSVEHWQQFVPLGEPSYSPLSSDTFSDCSSSDLAMGPLSPTGEWSTGLAMDNSTFLQPHEDDWQTNGVSLTSQASFSWSDYPNNTGSVELGLSPVLSHESQSAHTLASFSEPDVCILPGALDLSFTAEPTWQGPLIYSVPDVAPQSCDYGLTYSNDQCGASMACTSAGVGFYQEAIPAFFPQGGQAVYPKRNTSFPQSIQTRPILPRSEATAVSSQPAYGSQRHLRPQTNGPRHSLPAQTRVSNAAGLPQDGPVFIAPFHGPHVPVSHATNRIGASMHALADPTAEVFNDFVQVDMDHVPSARAVVDTVRVLPEYRMEHLETPNIHVDVKPAMSELEQEAEESRPEQVIKSEYMSSSSEADEGRHRTHPYYHVQQGPDGMYHCPFKAKGDPNCPHKPTKLKCNYDKFIDSHLKPFRCHKESCSKAEFSSTACLLRHEREAHGMHGHGDKPHLCYYPGCDRGMAGSGFPRRYNLFDHMKRVHDHKEDAADASGSPILGGETQKKIRGTKRKAVGGPVPEPVNQRPRTLSLPQQPSQAVQALQSGYYRDTDYALGYPRWQANGAH